MPSDLINTGVVNCPIMFQNARKMHHSEAKNLNIFRGEGTVSSPNPDPIGEGDTPSQNSPHRCLRRLDTRAFGAQPGPQTKILDPPVMF